LFWFLVTHSPIVQESRISGSDKVLFQQAGVINNMIAADVKQLALV